MLTRIKIQKLEHSVPTKSSGTWIVWASPPTTKWPPICSHALMSPSFKHKLSVEWRKAGLAAGLPKRQLAHYNIVKLGVNNVSKGQLLCFRGAGIWNCNLKMEMEIYMWSQSCPGSILDRKAQERHFMLYPSIYTWAKGWIDGLRTTACTQMFQKEVIQRSCESQHRILSEQFRRNRERNSAFEFFEDLTI